MRKYYIVTWGAGHQQRCTSKSEAFYIMRILLNDYDFVSIEVKFE